MDSESEQLQSDSSSPSNIQFEQPDASTALPNGPEAVVALVGGMDRSQRLASNWVTDSNRALLRRHMGITANLDNKTQEQQSRGFDVMFASWLKLISVIHGHSLKMKEGQRT